MSRGGGSRGERSLTGAIEIVLLAVIVNKGGVDDVVIVGAFVVVIVTIFSLFFVCLGLEVYSWICTRESCVETFRDLCGAGDGTQGSYMQCQHSVI